MNIEYEKLANYRHIRPTFWDSLVTLFSLFFKVLRVSVREFKYDPRKLLLGKKRRTRKRTRFALRGYETFQLETSTLETIKSQLLPLYEEYERLSQRKRISTLDDTQWALDASHKSKIEIALLSDEAVLEALRMFSEYRMTKNAPTITSITLQINSFTDPYSANRRTNQYITPCEYFHFDSVIGQLKLIVYLSDIEHENGPTSYCAGTHYAGSPKFKHYVGAAIDNLGLHKRDIRNMTRFMSLPKFLRVKADFGSDIPSDSPASDFYTRKECKIIGDAGLLIAFNPLGVHRGGIVARGRREILQIGLATR